jgi:hypothetical protein
MPFGPRVVFTKSAIAIAPTKEDILALSPYNDIISWWIVIISIKQIKTL